MRKLYKTVIIIIVVILNACTLVGSNSNIQIVENQSSIKDNPVKAAVVVYNSEDPFTSEILKNLSEIQKENEGKIQFTYFNSNDSQVTENKTIDTIVANKEFNLLLVSLVDINSSQQVINKAKEVNMPIIIYQREPYSKDAIRSYEKSIFIGTFPQEGGIIQGQILIDEWIKNKAKIDRNKDNIMQYIMIKGEIENLDTINRTKYSVLTIKDSGINTQELASVVANWKEEEAKDLIKSLLLRYGDKIEVIISNNDAMAIGAIKALQSIGYNTGNKDKTIPVVGVDAIPEARKLVDEGIMTGTVIQDARGIADALYATGMNLATGKKPLDGTTYEFDDTGVSIRIPYKRYFSSQIR